MKLKKLLITVCLLAVLPCTGQDISKQLNKELFYNFSYQELTELSKTPVPQGILKEKVDYLLNNPIVDNSINTDLNPPLQEDAKLGKFIRVASWNINRGLNLDNIKLLFEDSDKLLSTAKNKDEEYLKKLKQQADILKNINVIVMNEVDMGMPRTGYKNVAEELAKILKFNYAYGTEFIEVDPVHLGIHDYKWSEERVLLTNGEKFVVDKEKYKGLHGTAILSQFPLKNCRIIRLPNAYDWYKKENKRISELEVARRHAAGIVFGEDIFREIRQGGRMALLADIQIPGVDDPVTIVAAHLENRCIPRARKKQLVALLKELYNIKNPIVSKPPTFLTIFIALKLCSVVIPFSMESKLKCP